MAALYQGGHLFLGKENTSTEEKGWRGLHTEEHQARGQELNVASFRQDSNMLLAGEEIGKDDQARGVYKNHEEERIPFNIMIHTWLSLAALGCS